MGAALLAGRDLSMLGDQFAGHVQGRTLILDGDGPCYVAAATVKTLPTAVRRVQQMILEYMFLAGAESCEVHLTARGSQKTGRDNIRGVKLYQANRDGKDKPALLEATREALANRANWLPEFEVILHRQLEADDGMMMSAYRLGEHGVIRSEDKDLRMTPFNYWDIKKGVMRPPAGFGDIWMEYTEKAGTAKCVGHGRKFFWAQMLMGDTADNVAGLTKLDGKLCGPAGAYAFLKDVGDEATAANFVLSAYKRNKQNPMPEGYFLWMLRSNSDTFFQYLMELNLTPEIKAYVYEQASRPDWFVVPEVKEKEFDDIPY